jgi:hypothetical protein
MECLKNINEILNTIYLICAGPIFIYFAYRGLEQIRAVKESTEITQKNSKTQSKREAFKLAGEQCLYFGEKIIPLYSKLMAELKDNNCKFFEKFEVVNSKEKIEVKRKEKLTDDDFDGLTKSVYLQDVLNSLEGFSLFFASGVASEDVGYITAGRGYCDIVHKLMPIITLEFKRGYYKNISMLYVTWQNRCKQEDIKMKQKKLENELQDTSEINIKTIGT